MPVIGHSFTVLQSVDSTNNYAMASVRAGVAVHGNAYFSTNQTAGKGQRGKAWQTNEGENLALSIVIEPNGILLSQRFLLSISISLACYSLVKDYTGSGVTIKWPNDIYWCDRKAGGILIENLIRGLNWQYAVAGIGLNINQTIFPDHLPNPVSLKQVNGRTHDPGQLAKELCKYVESRFNQLLNGQHQMLLDEYHELLYKRNQWVRLRQGTVVLGTLVKRVTSQGRLVTEHKVEQEFDVGEVEWIS